MDALMFLKDQLALVALAEGILGTADLAGAPVDRDHLARAVRRGVRGEEQNRAGQVLDLADDEGAAGAAAARPEA